MMGCNPFMVMGIPYYRPIAMGVFKYPKPFFMTFRPCIFMGMGIYPPMNNNIFSIYRLPQNIMPADSGTNYSLSNNVSKPLPTTNKADNDATKIKPKQKIRYNAKKGKKLAQIIATRSSEGGFDNYCARNVKKAIEDAGLGEYKNGDAYQMAEILSKNKNFKEISTKNINLSTLPAGCVLVYDKGVAGYSSKYGHTEITLGDGTAASGGITHNIKRGARVFMPV